MRASFTIENPDKIEMTMTITMPVKQWKDTANTLKKENWHFSDKINDMVDMASKTFYPREGDE